MVQVISESAHDEKMFVYPLNRILAFHKRGLYFFDHFIFFLAKLQVSKDLGNKKLVGVIVLNLVHCAGTACTDRLNNPIFLGQNDFRIVASYPLS